MAPTSAQFRMADRVLDGHLVQTLTSLYAESGAWEEVARRLLVDHGVQVTGQTLRRWAEKLGLDSEAVA